MTVDEKFLEKWEERRKKGKKSYFLKGTAVGTIIILILLILKDFAVHQIVFSVAELGNLIFKNIFISAILAGFAAIQSWEWQERKYKNMKGKK
ncbi:MAG: hypothetical protein R6U59_03525 [Eubacteriales bacterium]